MSCRVVSCRVVSCMCVCAGAVYRPSPRRALQTRAGLTVRVRWESSLNLVAVFYWAWAASAPKLEAVALAGLSGVASQGR